MSCGRQMSDELGVDSESDVEEINDNFTTPRKKRKARGELSSSEKKAAAGGPKLFQTNWLSLPAFQEWLRAGPDPKHGLCIACNKTLKAGKSEFERHASTDTHNKNMLKIKGSQSVKQMFSPNSKKDQHIKDVKTAEISIGAVFAEHNIAINTADHLIEVFKKSATDSLIIKDVTLDRTKCSAIVRNVIAKTEFEETVENLRKYIDPKTNASRLDLLKLVELDPKDCSAAKLFEAFTNCLEQNSIPIIKFVGLACDNTNAMVGQHNSFYSRLKAVCPWLVLSNCMCHNSHLAASKACQKLPAEVKKLLSSITNYIGSSPKRTAELEEFTQFCEEQYNPLKRLSFTRWLVLQPCVVRLLSMYKGIKNFFIVAAFEEKGKNADAEWILSEIRNPFTKAYFYFLKYSLEFFNRFNAFFQGKGTLVHKLAKKSNAIITEICRNHVKPEYHKSLATTNLQNPSIQLPLEEIYVGPECQAILDKIPLPNNQDGKQTQAQLETRRRRDIQQFRLRCLNFYVTAAKEIQCTFPVNNQLFQEMEFIDPRVALDEKTRTGHLKDLGTLASHFKDRIEIDPTQVAFEWRTFPGNFDDGEKERLGKLSPEEFWQEIGKLETIEAPAFRELHRLSRAVIIMPHSNADSERIFSIVTDTKTKKRNRMGNDLLNSICLARTAFKAKGIDCTNFQVTDEHLKNIIRICISVLV
ncbi:Zinc finger protein 862 [Frankliniella fusca]|uniref:Zinc finger protein 862 n=1 Tax=Frankliniella fusca TaxID=407009 RepID=A0AAE1H8V8_9NEOP|nr:Zinc finger protein 862 [Frankliniella fusca]